MPIILQRLIIFGLPLVAGALAIRTPYVLTLVVFALINAVMALATSFCMGQAGQVTLAQSGFMAIGAYVAMLLKLRLGLSLGIGLPAAILVSAAAGYLLSLPIVKLKGHYLGLMTLAFSLMVAEVATHWTSVTNGASGLYGIQTPSIPVLTLDPQYEFLLILTLYLAGVYVFADNLIRSRYGRAMQALKHSELGAQSCGIDTTRFKADAFAISAGMIGGAGAFYAYFVRYIGPESFSIELSITIVAMCILGGITDLRGAVVGAGLITVLNEPLRAYPTYQPLVYASVIILTIIFLPRGIVPSLLERLETRRSRRALLKAVSRGGS